MTECQKGLYILLKEIDRICTENEIDYYLAGGTFIGAVRHRGFLPWDDDADIHMTRAGAEKFRAIINAQKDGKRIVLSQEEYPDYPSLHWRYVDLTRTSMLRSTCYTGTPSGQFVDIFILDPIPEDPEEQLAFRRLYELHKEITVDTFNIEKRRDVDFLNAYAEYRAEESREGRENLRSRLREHLFTYEADKTDYTIIRSPTAPYPVLHNDIWGKPQRVPFEDTTLLIAAHPEKILRLSYGETWFEIVETIDQKKHELIIDQELPHTVYENSYRSRIDYGTFLANERALKNALFSVLPHRNTANPKVRELQGAVVLQEVETFIRENSINLDKWIQEKRYDSLVQLFHPVFDFMSKTSSKYWGVTIDMPDDMLYAALYPMAMRGQFGQVRKLLLRRAAGEPDSLPQPLRELLSLAQDTALMLENLYTVKNTSEARRILDERLPEAPENIYFLRADIKLRLQNAPQEDDLCEIRAALNEYLQRWPDDPELLKYRGDIAKRRGDTAAALRDYRMVQSVLKNGIELMDLRDSLKSLEAAV